MPPMPPMRPNGSYLPPTGQKPPRFTSVDYTVLKSVERPKLEYIVDKITQIPGELYAKILSKERLIKSHFAPKPEKVVIYRYHEPAAPPRLIPIAVPYEVRPEKFEVPTTTTTQRPMRQKPGVVVEAFGDVDANALLDNGENVILVQPSARAVGGEGSTAIANPVSRVLVRKNVPTTILYRPQAVAISGPGGRSHAQSELIVDYIDE